MAQNDFWEKFKNTVKGATNVAADFAEEQALVGKLKFEILTLNRKAKTLRAKLGELVFDMAMQTPQPNPFDSAEVNSIISEIEDLSTKSEAKRSEISQVADYFRAKTASEKRDDYFDDEPVDPVPPFSAPFTPPVEEVVKETPKKSEPRKPEPRRAAPKQAEPRKAESEQVEEKPTETEAPAPQKDESPQRSRSSSSTRRPRSKSPSSRSRSSARRNTQNAEDKPAETAEKPATRRRPNPSRPAPAKKNASEEKAEPQSKETPDKQE